MKNFYDYLEQQRILSERFGDEDTIIFYISGDDKYHFLKKREKYKLGDIMVAYEKIKLNLKSDIYSPTNILDVFKSYNPNTNKNELWSKDYKVTYLRFLLYKVDDFLHIFVFDGDIIHKRMVSYLDLNKVKRHLPSIDYSSLYDAYYDSDIYLSTDFTLKDKDWCLPLSTPNPWSDHYMIDMAQYVVYLDQEIYKYFGINENEFISKVDYYV